MVAWKIASIYGIELASVSDAKWLNRMRRLQKDALHLMSSLDDLADYETRLHSMVSSSYWSRLPIVKLNRSS